MGAHAPCFFPQILICAERRAHQHGRLNDTMAGRARFSEVLKALHDQAGTHTEANEGHRAVTVHMVHQDFCQDLFRGTFDQKSGDFAVFPSHTSGGNSIREQQLNIEAVCKSNAE